MLLIWGEALEWEGNVKNLFKSWRSLWDQFRYILLITQKLKPV